MSSEMLRVLIVDDHPLVRTGLCTVLNATSDITVVAAGVNGADALRLVAEYCPDVLVLDVNLPDLSGIEVARQLQRQDSTTAILILTVHNDNETLFGLLEAGAAGYVLKDDAPETLADAVRAVACGASWLSPQVTRQVVHRALGAAADGSTSSCSLTPRELDVLRLLAQGLDNDAIAARLTLTIRTVQNHVSAIYGKLGVASRAEAILYAIRHQLAPIP